MRSPAHIANSVAQPAAVGGVLQRACACGGAKGPTGECAECRRKKALRLQAKLRVNQPGDRYEQEADRVADAVVKGEAAERSTPAVLSIQRLQRQETAQPEPSIHGDDPFEFSVPGPSAGPAAEEEQKDPFEGVGMSKRWGDLVTTWGWGAPETNNIYQECQIAPLKRKDFVGFVKSLPQKQHKRKKPLDAEEVLGVTHFNPNDAVPPTFEAESVQEDGRTAYRVKPTHAEMPPIRSAATQAEQYTEGMRRFAGAPCVKAGIQNSKEASRVQWNLTAAGAQKVAQAEQEHCDDITVAFDETLALYASMVNRKAASMRTYLTEQAAVNDAKAEVGLDHMQMLQQFYLTALRTEKRDANHWHTANHKLPTLQHREKPTFDNGCQHRELIDGRSMPEVGPKDSRPHSSYDVILQPDHSPGAPPAPSTAPAIVHDVLQAPGQSLDAGTRGFMEQRMGHDFSQVRIHTDAQAAASAQAVNARAYTVGRDVVFGPGQYAPGTTDGQRLLAHELTHVVQQGASRTRVQRAPMDSAPNDPLPGYSQEGDTCGATSLVSALMIWDRQRTTSPKTYELVATAANIVLTYLANHKTSTTKGWNKKGMDGEELYKMMVSDVTAVRDAALVPDTRLSESDYQTLGVALYFLYIDETAGLSAAEISSLQGRLGLDTDSQDHIGTYEDLYSNSVVSGLGPGQIAQIGWYVKTGPPSSDGSVPIGHHAFLIGRLVDGTWFLSDQGPRPPMELQADTLSDLKAAIDLAAREGRYWILTSAPTTMVLGGWTGAMLLGDPQTAEDQGESLVPDGTFIAQVDDGVFTSGTDIKSDYFVGTYYDFDQASYASGIPYHSGLIIEMPDNVWNVYATNLVDDGNVMVDEIDSSDSSSGLLGKKTFYHAWLRLCSDDKCSTELIKVY